MIPPILQDAGWYRATTLAERLKARRAQLRSHQNHERRAEGRMLRWRAQPPFTNASVFAQRLAVDGMTDEEFSSILSEVPECLRACFEGDPPWLTQLSEAFSAATSATAIPWPNGMDKQLATLAHAVDPLISHSLGRLRESLRQVLRTHPEAPVDPDTIERILLADLPQQLFVMLGRSLILELNVARLEGALEGNTPEDRFDGFVRRVRQPEIALGIMHEYPVLARQLTIRLSQWVAFTMEFLERLCTDWNLIRHTFSLDDDPGVLVHVETNAGDRHRNGRSVLIARFGSAFCLVYKPKSMAVEVHFQELLTWMNQGGGETGFRTLQVLDRGSHGWAEFVAAETCDSPPALRRFYERQGAYLALLRMLEATDFHNENVIAAGEHPVLVDVEGLFHPQHMVPQGEDEEVAAGMVDHSVLRVGLLPQRDCSNPESEGVDFSGLGGAAGQLTPYAVPGWENPGTDEMRLTRRRLEMPVASNRPSHNGNDVNPADYAAEIVTGFSRGYRLLMERREELLSPSGPLRRFSDDEVRVVLRPTRTYGVLLQESFHPDVLRDALDRDLLFDRLWVAVEKRPDLARVLQAEREDLQRGDIPMFTTRPSSRDLWTSSGHCIEGFFDEPSLARVQRRLLQLSERDLDLQLWFIRASLATTAPAYADWEQRPASRLRGTRGAVDDDQLLGAARTLGDRLESMAIRADRAASWIGLLLEDEGHWSVSPLTVDLYDGLPGVTLFLAYLGAITEERRYTDLAQDACATMLSRCEECKSFVTSIGAFDGWGGIIYALAHLGALWRDPDLLNNAETIVALLPGWIEHDERFDIIGGAAGCIGGLIALYAQLPSQRTLTAAVQCGQHLIAQMEQTEYGIGWTIPKERTPLSGFAHGGAGIAWALLKLAALTGDERFRTSALGAIAHERSLFSPQARNWRDLRVAKIASPRQEARESCRTAWCSGAPGIGLARLSVIGQLDDTQVRGEIDTALHTTLDVGFGHNHSLCHGDLGNLELLLQAGKVLDDPRWLAEAYRLVGPIVDRVNRSEYLCGTPSSVESPGLMTGLAGIGYGLLRLAEPARVPCVLTLEPPIHAEDAI